ncbi:hypothetical protein [Salinibacter phage M8CC-19]|uniref:Uncharacterized protein n=2 Tax=Kryptosalinivirus M8CC19 TaxID=2560720 RepID=A0A2I6UGF0_9CAUD|nr:hypothetical protein FGG63_gp31 [Salinibacter phage M8CC-19]AUO78996.1 hypothetical protein [Salinibacter phage M8CC-19]AUO79231.1 hypothetical protein [Salinibacter phage M31CC-1]
MDNTNERPTLDNAVEELEGFFDTLEGALEDADQKKAEAETFVERSEDWRKNEIRLVREAAQESMDQINDIADTAVEQGQAQIEEVRQQEWALVKKVVVRPVKFVGRLLKRIFRL